MGRMICKVAQAKTIPSWLGCRVCKELLQLTALSSSSNSQPGSGRWREENVTSGHNPSCEPALPSPLILPNASSPGSRCQSCLALDCELRDGIVGPSLHLPHTEQSGITVGFCSRTACPPIGGAVLEAANHNKFTCWSVWPLEHPGQREAGEC